MVVVAHQPLEREAGVAILLDDQDVSRHHAVLDRAGSRVVLTDPGSTNGTWVNRRQLRPGDPRDRVELPGALAASGIALAESIAKIAHWLGPLAAGVLALL